MVSKTLLEKAIGLIDHTSLNTEDTEESISVFLKNAFLPGELHPAAICVYPKFVPLCKRLYPNARVAAVINFPMGEDVEADVIDATKRVIAAGVDEIDLVINYRLILTDSARGLEEAKSLTAAVHAVCSRSTPSVLLKVIIESGELKCPKLIENTCKAVIEGGADFLKTSTGKVPVNATVDAAVVMLSTIASWKAEHPESRRSIGFKAAGGVKTPEECKKYLDIASSLFGSEWITPKIFRFGASSLLSVLCNAHRVASGNVAESCAESCSKEACADYPSGTY